MEVTVNDNLCMGCGRCRNICSGVFKMVVDKAMVSADPTTPSDETDSLDAKDQCPAFAIRVTN